MKRKDFIRIGLASFGLGALFPEIVAPKEIEEAKSGIDLFNDPDYIHLGHCSFIHKDDYAKMIKEAKNNKFHRGGAIQINRNAFSMSTRIK